MQQPLSLPLTDRQQLERRGNEADRRLIQAAGDRLFSGPSRGRKRESHRDRKMPRCLPHLDYCMIILHDRIFSKLIDSISQNLPTHLPARLSCLIPQYHRLQLAINLYSVLSGCTGMGNPYRNCFPQTDAVQHEVRHISREILRVSHDALMDGRFQTR